MNLDSLIVILIILIIYDLRPEKERFKSLFSFLNNGLGKIKKFSFPLMLFSTSGPPGNFKPNAFPILSKASPTASSKVPPIKEYLFMFLKNKN